jgi:hypothetical protein
MEKIGQRRGKWQRLKEDWSPGGIGGKLVETFSPEFQELMDKLREVDDAVRSIVDPEDKENNLKDLLKVAKANFNRREYMKSVAYLGKFHDQLELVDQELAKLQNSVDMKHYQFLFGDLEPEHLEYLTKGLAPKFDKARKTPTGILTRASLDKEAGVVDWWHTLKGDRRGTLAAYEKRFPRYMKDLKNQTNLMINRSEGLLNFLLASLKVMNGLRNSRKLEEYIKVSKKLQEKFKSYNVSFIQFYNGYVKSFLDYQQSMQKDDEPEDTEILTSPTIPAAAPSKDSDSITPDKDLPTLSEPAPTPIPTSSPDPDVAEIAKTNPAYAKRLTEMAKNDPEGAKKLKEFREWLRNPPKRKPRHDPGWFFRAPEPEQAPPAPPPEVPDTEPDVVDKWRNIFEGQGVLPSPQEPSSLTPQSTAAPLPLVNRKTRNYPISTPAIELSKMPSSLEDSEIKTPAISFTPDAGVNERRPKIAPSPPLPADLVELVVPPDTQPNPMRAVKPLKHKADHTAFLTSLASLEEEHPMVLAKELIRYARSIQASDPEMSSKLLTIAHNALRW